MSVTADLNDYSSRVNITGVTIASIPIDIVAQTIGNITIDIAAASMGPIAISINVVNIVGNIPIDIVAQTIGNITIDIAAASMGSIAVSINVADIVGNLPIDIVAQTIGNISIDIAAQTVGNIGIDIAANSFGNLPIDIVAQTIGNIGISLNANTAGNITVDIAAQTMVGNLSIDIAANSFGNLPIDIVAQTIGNIGINLAANTLGNLTIDIAAQTLGNIAIDVAAQTVDLNIKTSGGVNIIIDKLEQGAYKSRGSTLSNDNGVTTPTAPPIDSAGVYHGKFFPRGCRGFLSSLSVYCKRTAAGTITLSYSPHPSMGAIGSVVITPGAAWDWKSGNVYRMWNYDSMFIWVSACSVDVLWGYDGLDGSEAFDSADNGVTWSCNTVARYFIRALMAGETVGDIPVSGTINTIPIPNAVIGRRGVGLVIPAGVTLYDTIQYGSGKVLIIQYVAYDAVARDNLRLRLRIDGAMALPTDQIMAAWEQRRIGESTPGITVGKWDTTNHHYCIVVTLPYPFRHSLEVGFHNSHPTNAQNGIVCYVYEKIS